MTNKSLSKKSVLVVSEYFPLPTDNGSKKRIWHFLRALSDVYYVHLATFGEEVTEPHLSQVRRLCEVHLCPAPQLRFWQTGLNLLSLTPLGVWRRSSKNFTKLVKDVVNLYDIDLVVTIEIWMAQYTHNLSEAVRFIDKHNLEFVRARRRLHSTADYPIWKQWPLNLCYSIIAWRLKRYELEMLDLFDQIIVCSDKDADILNKSLSEDSVSVIPNGVDLEFFHPSKAASTSGNIVFVGTMSYEPNVDAVLFFVESILPIIKDQVDNVEFNIVGRDPPAKIRALTNRSEVNVTGYVDDIRPYVWDAAVVVVPLRMGSGTRIKILEALAMNKSVVTTSIGCEGLVLKPERDLLVADEPQSFAEAVLRILRDVTLAQNLACNGRKVVKREYSWTRSRELLVSLIVSKEKNRNWGNKAL